MPTITINKQDLFKQLGKKLSDDKLKDRISMLGTDIEQVTDSEVVVEIFPNRPDMLSSEGFARALSAFIGLKKGLRSYKIQNSNYTVKIDPKVKTVRQYAAAAVVKGVKLDAPTTESLMQLQEKLHATHGRNRRKASIGVYDLNTIKFPLIYTTKPKSFKFRPLETKIEMTLNKILTKHPKGKEYAHLLDNFEEYPIWIDTKGQVLSMPPIINSEETKVKQKTTDLFIDVTGLDLLAVEQTLNIIVTSLADRGGKIYPVKINSKIYPDLNPRSMKLNKNYVNKRLGITLNDKDIKVCLEKMGLGWVNSAVIIPSYRSDILHQVDLVEDIAIGYGYENFDFIIPSIATIASEDEFEKFKNKVANMIIGFGLLETNTYNLTSKKNQLDKTGLDFELVEVANALNEEYNVLRAWMVPSLLEVLQNNKQYEYPQRIFEIGQVFNKKGSELSEASRLAVLLADKETDFTAAKQILDSVLSMLGLSYEVKPVKHNSFIEGRVGRVIIKGKEVAYLGELSPETLTSFDLEVPVVGFELNITELFKLV